MRNFTKKCTFSQLSRINEKRAMLELSQPRKVSNQLCPISEHSICSLYRPYFCLSRYKLEVLSENDCLHTTLGNIEKERNVDLHAAKQVRNKRQHSPAPAKKYVGLNKYARRPLQAAQLRALRRGTIYSRCYSR